MDVPHRRHADVLSAVAAAAAGGGADGVHGMLRRDRQGPATAVPAGRHRLCSCGGGTDVSRNARMPKNLDPRPQSQGADTPIRDRSDQPGRSEGRAPSSNGSGERTSRRRARTPAPHPRTTRARASTTKRAACSTCRRWRSWSGPACPTRWAGPTRCAHYTGIVRHTKDLDLFLREADLRRAFDAFRAAGCRTELTHPHWIGKAYSPRRPRQRLEQGRVRVHRPDLRRRETA